MNSSTDVYPGETDREDLMLLPRSFVCIGITATVIEDLLRKDGCDARVMRFKNSIIIRSSANGTAFMSRLRHYDEKLKSYGLLSFSACYANRLSEDEALNALNRFNQNFPLINAQLIHLGKIRIQMDLLTGRGVYLAQIAQWLRVWRGLMPAFEGHWLQAGNIKLL